jgi:hypothetical protein
MATPLLVLLLLRAAGTPLEVVPVVGSIMAAAPPPCTGRTYARAAR